MFRFKMNGQVQGRVTAYPSLIGLGGLPSIYTTHRNLVLISATSKTGINLINLSPPCSICLPGYYIFLVTFTFPFLDII